DWICLRLESRDSLGQLEDGWNDFDHLGPATKLLHNTKRQTQPWKTGLQVDFTRAKKRAKLGKPASWLPYLRGGSAGSASDTSQPHPDPRQEQLFSGLLRECVDQGSVTESMLREAMRSTPIGPATLAVLDRTPPLADRRRVHA